MQKYSIGIDIGGTNTDVVLIDTKKNIICKHKQITTSPVEKGVISAICTLLTQAKVTAEQIERVSIGTTHATNAILQAKELLPVGLIRIAGQFPDTSAGYFWPKELKEKVLVGTTCIAGGFDCDGEEISAYDDNLAKCAIGELLAKGAKAFAVISVFSPMKPEHEHKTKKLIHQIVKDVPVTLSSDIGGIGFIERENATILNAALHKVISNGFASLQYAIQKLGIEAPLYMVQNDGGVMDLSHAMKWPISTIGAGQTNSLKGGCFLSGIDSAIVIDIGGTSTDIGLVQKGHAVRSMRATQIGGVTLHFAMPDVLSLAIGGGSVIANGCIGPQSVARELLSNAQMFGGSHLTLTDVALVLGLIDIAGADQRRIQLSDHEANAIIDQLRSRLVQSLQVAYSKHNDLPIVIVGGAAAIIAHVLKGTLYESRVVVAPHAAVANAFGAARSLISHTCMATRALHQRRAEILDEIKQEAIEHVIKKGADPNGVRIVALDIMPYAYSQDGLAKISVTAQGVF